MMKGTTKGEESKKLHTVIIFYDMVRFEAERRQKSNTSKSMVIQCQATESGLVATPTIHY